MFDFERNKKKYKKHNIFVFLAKIEINFETTHKSRSLWKPSTTHCIGILFFFFNKCSKKLNLTFKIITLIGIEVLLRVDRLICQTYFFFKKIAQIHYDRIPILFNVAYCILQNNSNDIGILKTISLIFDNW